MLNDLIREFVQKLPESIRSEICFRLVVFLDQSRLAEDDLEKAANELLSPPEALDRFRVLVIAAGVLDFVFATFFSEADVKLLEFLQNKAPTAQIGFHRLKDFQGARNEWNQMRQTQLAPANIRDQQKNLLPE